MEDKSIYHQIVDNEEIDCATMKGRVIDFLAECKHNKSITDTIELKYVIHRLEDILKGK